MASLDKAIAELSARFGSHPGGGDSMELPHMGGPTTASMGMPGGTIGTNSFAIGEPDPTTHGHPKSGMAAGTVGTAKSAHIHPDNPLHHAHRIQPDNPLHHAHRIQPDNPLHHAHRSPKQPPVTEPPISVFAQGGSPGATVGTKTPVMAVAKSASPGATIGTKTPVEKSVLSAAAAPAPAGDNGLGSLGLLTGGGGQLAQPVLGSKDLLSSKGGGGAAGGIVGTRTAGG
ncbi:MAG TPA: hypothetical protein VFA20_06705 [Myxococcaceae bacterium]|nr:hypothetical protein [Myxococcaceae bacterium]